MINETGKWEGIDGMGEEALREIRGDTEHRLLEAVVHGANELKVTLSGTRSGREYRVSKTGRLHIASAPGEPPAVLFGNLRNSAGWSEPVWEGNTVSAEWGIGLGKPPDPGVPDPETSYGPRLEFGGIDSRGVKIEARPFMEPTAIRVQDRIDQILEG